MKEDYISSYELSGGSEVYILTSFIIHELNKGFCTTCTFIPKKLLITHNKYM